MKCDKCLNQQEINWASTQKLNLVTTMEDVQIGEIIINLLIWEHSQTKLIFYIDDTWIVGDSQFQ